MPWNSRQPPIPKEPPGPNADPRDGSASQTSSSETRPGKPESQRRNLYHRADPTQPGERSE